MGTAIFWGLGIQSLSAPTDGQQPVPETVWKYAKDAEQQSLMPVKK